MNMIKWFLKDFDKIKKNNKTVFSCFCCGGGSTMGYKLAGYTSLGGLEIDPKMANVYKTNHNPKYFYELDIRDFLKIKDIPDELYDLDILDGSPPCSVFSKSSTKREQFWEKKKKFREGQKEQRLDDLFFYFLDVANKLQPKVIIAENVKGLLMGRTKVFARKILKKFQEIGYHTQIFLLNSKFMEVPQARERVFFIGIRKDVAKKLKNNNLVESKLKLNFNHRIITAGEAINDLPNDGPLIKPSTKLFHCWQNTTTGQKLHKGFFKIFNKMNFWDYYKIHRNQPCKTIPATDRRILNDEEPRFLSYKQISRLQTFPEDFDFCKMSGNYICGMSVPPMMIKNIAVEIHKQIL